MRVGVLATLGIFALVALPLTAAAGPAQDTDGDGTFDVLDICSANVGAVTTAATSPSPCGLDTDQDGFGNACDGDFNIDGVTDSVDAGIITGDLNAGTDASGTGTDMNCDGVVDSTDAGIFVPLLSAGAPPGPSGLSCAGTVPCP